MTKRKWWETPLKIHYTEMTADPPDHPLYRESETYRRELPRLLAEGHEGKSVLIKGETILGIFEDYDEARSAGHEKFLLEPFLAYPILEWQPVVRQYISKLSVGAKEGPRRREGGHDMARWDHLPKVHCTEKVAELPPESPIYQESRTYDRELPRLLAEGHEGKVALIKGEEIIGIFDDENEALRVGYEKYLGQSFLAQPIREWEPILFESWRFRPCHTSPSQ